MGFVISSLPYVVYKIILIRGSLSQALTFSKKKNIIIFMDPTYFMNLSFKSFSLWTGFVTVSRTPRHVATRDWFSNFFF